MKIGIIGTDQIGDALTRRFTRLSGEPPRRGQFPGVKFVCPGTQAWTSP